MTTRLALAPTDNHLDSLRQLAVGSLIRQGVHRADAEDAAQEMLEKVTRRPRTFAWRVADLDNQVPYFTTMALNTYRMRLRAERRRRQREQTQHYPAAPVAEADEGTSTADALALAADAPLSDLQRQYLEAVLIHHMSVEDIATTTGTTPRAVRAVLARAALIVREQFLRAVA